MKPRIHNPLTILGFTFAALLLPAGAVDFHPISEVTTFVAEYFPSNRMIEGAGVGFDAAEPHDRTSNQTWVTNASGGDWFAAQGPVIVVFDLGSDVALGEMSTWGYADSNTNGAKDFSLRFATDAEGTDGFGSSIAYNPAFEADLDQTLRDSNVFSETVVARYVEMTITDNWKGAPGIPGGDRVGLGEAAFAVILVAGEPNIEVTAEVMPELAYDSITTFEIPVGNTGEQSLIIAGTDRTGANAAAFTVTNVVSPIASLTAENITIEFNPAGLGGPITATLVIMSNDPDTPNAEVLITSSLPELGADISVPIQVDLTAGGAAETITVPVENLGRLQLNIDSTNITGPNAANFVVTTVPASIAGESSDNILIDFVPGALPSGALSATLEINTNDLDTPKAEVLLSGGIPASFYPISEVTSATSITDFFVVDNFIEGIGVGFEAGWPHDRLGSATWVTNAPNGGAGDYFAPLPTPAPVIVLDLGEDVLLAEVSFWGYADDNANGASSFSLRFATAADGPTGFGSSIAYNPTFESTQPVTPRQSFAFDQAVGARYVEWTPLDNFFGVNPPGGDRIGAGEIAFEIVPGVSNRFGLTIASAMPPATGYDLEWESQSGMLYNLRSSPNLAGELSTWTLVEGDIPATPPTNMKNVDPSEAMLFYRVEEFRAPPVTIFEEKFDGADPGWTTGFEAEDTLMNTEWQGGVPNVPGPATANSGANCYGTNLDANYGINSATWLRTPPINLTTATEATLRFQQWVDMDNFDDGDTGTVRVLDASVEPMTVLEILKAGIQGVDPKWEPFSAQLTEASLGHSVVLEFLFVSDDFGQDDASGWYIDDVRVTTPAP